MFLKKKSIKGELDFPESFREATHLYCHTSGYMEKGKQRFALQGRKYKIQVIKESNKKKRQFVINSDFSDNHHFNIDGEDAGSKNMFNRWFTMLREDETK